MTSAWTNEAAIRQWNTGSTRESMEATAESGDFSKRHLGNPVLLRLLGDVRGRRVLDAGCGNGYFSRILAGRGAEVTGVEPAESLISFAREKSAEGISYLQADLAELPELEPFDAVVCSMVLMAIPDWKPAMRACVEAVRPGGLFVFAIVHPAFEELFGTWREHGEYRRKEYLAEYEIVGGGASDFHRPISAYLNEVAALGCRVREVVEPGLDPEVGAASGIEAYVRMPNFLIVAAETGCPSGR
ncbi:class I SAM-dependent methyltransferase [Amycolatopsis circi]|uniref:class I SAM-dependent methyltransferase n=1 Tax=Amycolatopsis circi TaxID=871959 RepID=UPI000E25DADC|nr:class I SAM-dependent methyltransferase [Amycolatopsis circi]